MALRDQPYIPLYIQDYMTDEKLNMCSWETQGIYIKIMCVLHKQKEYGKILFKQNSKQEKSTVEYYASILVRQIPCQLDDMINALSELIYNEVMLITDESLYQKRMVKDGKISEVRSKAGKKGGGNPLFKQKSKQTDKLITEYENEYIDGINKGGVGGIKIPDSDATNPDYIKFIEWMHNKTPYCADTKNFPKQIMEKQFLTLKEKYNGKQIANTMMQLENRKDLRKRYTDLYLTINNWLKREYGQTTTT